jgi:uncharacterized protein (TIGR00251 family)
MTTITTELQIFVKPNAKKSALLEVKDGVWHIALHAKPTDGEANVELVRFLSELLDVPKSLIALKRGEKSRHKCVMLQAFVLQQKRF